MITRRDGVQKLLSLLDDMRARPTRRQGDLPLPTLLIRGQADDVADTAAVLQSRQNPPPRAFVTVYTAADVQPRHEIFADILRHAAEQLASAAPRGEARIRFPLLYHVIWLSTLALPEKRTEIDAYVKQAITSRSRQISLTGGGQGPQSMRANVRAYIEGPLTAWFALASLFNVTWLLAWNASLLPIFLSVGISVVGIIAHIWVVSRSWAGSVRYRWFNRQPYIWSKHEKAGDRPTDATSFAIRVVQARYTAGEPSSASDSHPATRRAKDQRSANTAIELLLVNAFLEDLRQSYDRSLWRVWRRVTWTRTVYPMLLLDGACAALAERFEQVRTQTATPDPLLLVAMPTEGNDLSGLRPNQVLSDAVRPEDVDHVWRAWLTGLARDRRVSSRRTLLVDVDAEHVRLLQADGSVPRPARRKPFLSRLWVPVTLVTTLVAGPAVYALAAQFGKCQPGISRVETGECIGIGVDGFVFDELLRSVTERIEANNRKVMESGSPPATVYHLGAFSVPEDSAAGAGDLLADAHGELVGAALVQEELIGNSKGNHKPLLRILPVNAGSEYRYASQAVGMMLDQIDRDKSVVGVIGANESRESVRQALIRLGARAVPVLTTTATYDDLSKTDGGQILPSVFPLAPPNTELARHAAHWAENGVPGYFNPPGKVGIFMDGRPDDLYSSHLGEQFQKEFSKGVSVTPFLGADSIRQSIHVICEGSSKPNLIFYAGRASQFGEFYSAASSSCVGITVIAGDAVTEYFNDRPPQLTSSQIKMFYMPLALKESWEGAKTCRNTFYEVYEEFLKELKLDEGQQPSAGYAAIAYDAADVLAQATNVAYSGQRTAGPSGREVDRAGITLALERRQPTYGVSGFIKLHAEGEGSQQPRDRPIHLVYTEQKKPGEWRQIVVAQCGKLYMGQPPGKNCPKSAQPNPATSSVECK